MVDAIVVGGGIVGMSTAYHLVAAGAQTLLIDRADAGQATAAGAGIIAPDTTTEVEAWFDFAAAAVDYYPVLMEQLHAAGIEDVGYAPMQELMVAVTEDEDAAFAHKQRVILARQQRTGRPAQADFETIDAAAAQKMFPAIESVRHAMRFARAGRIDGRLITAAMQSAALDLGLTVKTSGVERLVLEGQTVTGVVAAGETLASGAVVIAGGAWSGTFGAQLGVTLPIEPMRGQIIHLSLPDVDTSQWSIVTAFHGHYLVPWSDHRVVVGATREQHSGFGAHTTVQGVQQVLSEALRVAPGLAGATIAEIRVGLRPATPDRLPILGSVPNIRNVYVAAGHTATGLQLGPYSGKLMAALIAGQAPPVGIDAFAVTRFSN